MENYIIKHDNLMRNPFKSLVLAFITMFAGIAASAQVTTASLGGRVVDQNGEPVIGAAIVASTSLPAPATAP